MIIALYKNSDNLNNTKDIAYDFLEEAVLKYCGIENAKEKVKKTKCGKPYIDGCTFSLTHSKNLVGVALCTNKTDFVNNEATVVVEKEAYCESIGIDIESISEKSADRCRKIASAKFFENEISALNECKTDDEYVSAFCAMWTKKESYCKYTGVGLKDALKLDTTKDSEKPLKFYTTILKIGEKDYALSVCYNSK